MRARYKNPTAADERIEPHGVSQLLQRLGGSSDKGQHVGEPGIALGLAGIERNRAPHPGDRIKYHGPEDATCRERDWPTAATLRVPVRACAGKALDQLRARSLRVPSPGHVEVLDIGDFRMSRCESQDPVRPTAQTAVRRPPFASGRDALRCSRPCKKSSYASNDSGGLRRACSMMLRSMLITSLMTICSVISSCTCEDVGGSRDRSAPPRDAPTSRPQSTARSPAHDRRTGARCLRARTGPRRSRPTSAMLTARPL